MKTEKQKAEQAGGSTPSRYSFSPYLLMLSMSTVLVLLYAFQLTSSLNTQNDSIHRRELSQKSEKLFSALSDAHHCYYDQDSGTLGTSYYSRNVYSRQTYVANGYIGARLSTLGQGFSYDEINTHVENDSEQILENGWPLFNQRYTGSFVSGFYSLQEHLPETNFPELYELGYDSVLSSIPYWANIALELELNNETYHFDPEFVKQDEITNFYQNTSLLNGVVSTELRWLDKLDIKIDVTAHREILPLGIIEFELKPLLEDLKIQINDRLNFSTGQRTDLVNLGFDDAGVYIEVSPNNVDYSRTAIYSSWDLENSTAQIVNTTTINQSTKFLKKGETFKFVKYVGIASTERIDGTGSGELSFAKNVSLSAKNTGINQLRCSHDEKWRSLIEDVSIVIPSDDLLTLAAQASLFHLLTNTNSDSANLTAALSTVGLSSDSYGGMVFWDTDFWIIPALLPFDPKAARAISSYRNFTHNQAIKNAKLYDYEGAIYPWTSGRFGNCTSTGPCIDYEYHINVDIALSSFLLYTAGEDEEYLKYTAWPLLKDASDFLSQYIKYNETLQLFVTQNLTDPDEYANHVDNGAFTNAGIDTLLQVSIAVAKHLNETINPLWTRAVNNIYVPVSKHGITQEYSEMNASVSIKQADVVLLSFPLEYNERHGPEQAIKDMYYYSLKQADIGPAMTFPIFTVAASRFLNQGCSSQSYLQKSVLPYIRSPFAQFSEQADDNILTNGGTHPAFPFLTAHAGYLQALVYGILGVKYSARFNTETNKIERFLKYEPVKSPALPGGLKVSGFIYMNQVLDIILTDEEGVIVHKGDTPIQIEVQKRSNRSGNYTLNPGEKLTVPVFTPEHNIPGSLCECNLITNLTTGSPGEVPLSAIDGNNYTYWQPLTKAEPGKLLIDLGSYKNLTKGFVIWGAKPARYLSLHAYVQEDYINKDGLTSIDDIQLEIDNLEFQVILNKLEIEISVPYEEKYLKEVALLPNNETAFDLEHQVTARFVIVEILDSLSGDDSSDGGTISEIALF